MVFLGVEVHRLQLKNFWGPWAWGKAQTEVLFFHHPLDRLQGQLLLALRSRLQ